MIGSAIVVLQDRAWFGDPRLAAFVVSVDGSRAAIVPLQSRVTVPTSPRRHRVRVRQWWYQSSAVEVVVAPGETVTLRADIPRNRSVLARMGGMLLKPWHALALEVVPVAPNPR